MQRRHSSVTGSSAAKSRFADTLSNSDTISLPQVFSGPGQHPQVHATRRQRRARQFFDTAERPDLVQAAETYQLKEQRTPFHSRTSQRIVVRIRWWLPWSWPTPTTWWSSVNIHQVHHSPFAVPLWTLRPYHSRRPSNAFPTLCSKSSNRSERMRWLFNGFHEISIFREGAFKHNHIISNFFVIGMGRWRVINKVLFNQRRFKKFLLPPIVPLRYVRSLNVFVLLFKCVGRAWEL